MGKHIQIHLTPEQRTEIEERIRLERENALALFKEVLNQVWEESEHLQGRVDEKQLRAYQRIYVLVEGAVKGMLAEELDEAQMEGLLDVMGTLAAGLGVSDSDVETATRRLLRAGVNIFRPLSGTSEVFLEVISP
jgi:DNA-binding MarR family transcriptional regulator